MQVSIERGDCISCGLCVSACPQVFRIAEDGLAEAARLGFDQAVVPLAGSAELRPVDGVRVLAVGHVGEALGAALPRG